MSNDTIFWAQVGPIIGYLLSIFATYRILISKKDATIQFLKEKESFLKEQLSDARSLTPDILAEVLTKRVKSLEIELEILLRKKDANLDLIQEKEDALRMTRQNVEELTKQVLRARELLSKFLCPVCGSPLLSREYYSELVEYKGRELDVDHECTVFECGYSTVDGRISRSCGSEEVRKEKSILLDNS